MAESFEVRRIVPATPERVFRAWLDDQEHSAMTGSTYRNLEDGVFSAWAGYISGKTLEQEPGRRLVQSWRTTEFPPDAPDSRLELVLSPADSGTEILLRHTELPDGQGEAYRSGWEEHYFDPMEEYFGMAVARSVDQLDDDGDNSGDADAVAVIQVEVNEESGAERAAPKAKKPAPKKPAKKPAKPPAKKAASRKPAKKASAKKPAARKAAPKRSAKKAPAARKAAPKKKAAARKPAKKGRR